MLCVPRWLTSSRPHWRSRSPSRSSADHVTEMLWRSKPSPLLTTAEVNREVWVVQRKVAGVLEDTSSTFPISKTTHAQTFSAMVGIIAHSLTSVSWIRNKRPEMVRRLAGLILRANCDEWAFEESPVRTACLRDCFYIQGEGGRWSWRVGMWRCGRSYHQGCGQGERDKRVMRRCLAIRRQDRQQDKQNRVAA